MGINDVSEAFTEWLEALTGTRNTSSFVDGRPVAGGQTALNFDGVVQNATPKDLKVLPEGDRDSEAIKIHTEYRVLNKDLINYDGEVWLVANIAGRKIGNYYKAIAVKQ